MVGIEFVGLTKFILLILAHVLHREVKQALLISGDSDIDMQFFVESIGNKRNEYLECITMETLSEFDHAMREDLLFGFIQMLTILDGLSLHDTTVSHMQHRDKDIVILLVVTKDIEFAEVGIADDGLRAEFLDE